MKIFIPVLIAALLLFSTSCKKEFYTKANVNTNQPTSVPPGTLLPGIEVSLAYAQGGDASRYAQLFVQQGFGAAREATAYYDYQISGTNLPEQLWDNMYTSDMENIYTLLNMSTTNGYNAYAGIANILMAYSLQVTVDFWGNVPYSQAFLGSANIEPAYDKDASLYSTMINLINTGIADLNSSPGTLVPSTDDVMYNGSASAWIAFATALKARLYIHQCKHNNVAMCDSALNCAQRALADGFANAKVAFVQGVPNSSPVYQYNTGWGDITYVTSGGVHATLYDTMLALLDPRIGVYFDTAGAATSATPIVGMDPNTYYGKATSPVEFITKEELDFIEAEATLRSGGTLANALIYYNNAITDNFTKLGLASSATAYETANPLLPTNGLYQIAKQEWIALFINPEEWACWRRTGVPALVAPVGAASTQIPRRMVLPNSEVTENANAPQNETLWTPVVFWDN